MNFLKKFDVEAMNTQNGKIAIYVTSGAVLYALIRFAVLVTGG